MASDLYLVPHIGEWPFHNPEDSTASLKADPGHFSRHSTLKGKKSTGGISGDTEYNRVQSEGPEGWMTAANTEG